MKINSLYFHRMLVINTEVLLEYFGYQIYKDMNMFLLISFLQECPVQTLVSVKDSSFEYIHNATDMVKFLNAIWGQNHFSVKEAKKRNGASHTKSKIFQSFIC